ncbi:MAG TPA: cytochrome C [Gammaproteobacteria bacterium]|nr:cytochrome C [Gammaproteobacteria bacterium]
MKTTSIFSASLFAGLTIIMASSQAVAETGADSPEPLELRKIMRDLGKDMQTMVDGIAKEDWGQVQKAAMRIADHPAPPLMEKMRIVAFMGRDMGKFKDHDGKTHNAARDLATVATEKDGYAVISAFSRLQNTCLGCHQHFRQPFQEHFYGQH